MLNNITTESTIDGMISIAIVAAIYFVLRWATNEIFPEPFKRIVKIIITVGASLFLIDAILSIIGKSIL